MKPTLSIVTPIYNGEKTLKSYLEAVFNSQFQSFELIIMDGLSNDFSERICREYEVKYEQIGRLCESDYKRNRGVELASADLVLFLDCDIVIPPTALGNVVDVFRDHPEVVGLIGSYDDSPGGTKITSQFKFLLHHYIHQQEAEYIDSFWTGFGAIKKSVFKSAGGFNASYLHGGSIQDVELGYRLKKDRHRIYNAKNIQVKHLKELDLWEWIYTDIVVRGVPWVMIMMTYRDLSLKLNTRLDGILSVLFAWAMVFLTIAALFDRVFIYGIPVMLVLFLVINGSLLKFFAAKKNVLFSVIFSLYLFVYYFNCGICVLTGPFFYAAKHEKNR